MNPVAGHENLVDRLVTYTLEIDGRFVVIERVPARVDEETGERFFAPATVERLHEIVRDGSSPIRTVETPIFDFAA